MTCKTKSPEDKQQSFIVSFYFPTVFMFVFLYWTLVTFLKNPREVQPLWLQ